MSAEENKAVVRRLVEELVNKGDLAVVDEISTPISSIIVPPPERRLTGRASNNISPWYAALSPITIILLRT